MFASFFETNFPNIPFFKPNLLYILAVFCFSCFCVCFRVLCICFLFYVGFVLVCFVLFCFVFVVCFAVGIWKTMFSLQFQCLELRWHKGGLFLCYMVSLVWFGSSLNSEVVLFYVCVVFFLVFVTRLGCFLFVSCGLVSFCGVLFWFFDCFVFFIPQKNRTRTQQKPKPKMQKTPPKSVS